MKQGFGNLNKFKKFKILYEPFMAILALAMLVVLIIEYTRPLTEAQVMLLTYIDLTILGIFALDYFYRLFKAQGKWLFFKQNVFDLIAIMPFDKAFRLARLVRLTRLTRLTRLSRATRVSRLVRVAVMTKKFTANIRGILKMNGLQYVLVFTLIMILFGIRRLYL